MVDENLNPRGEKRPQDGRGLGEGLEYGRRGNINTDPCPFGRSYREPALMQGKGRVFNDRPEYGAIRKKV